MAGFNWADSGSFTIGDQSLEYRCYGPGPVEREPVESSSTEKLTLVLLHEGLGCAALWKDFPSRLHQATNCGVLVYSRVGYGQSDPCALPRPTDYMHREAMQVLPKILDATGIQRCILIGHSDGASIAAIYSGSAQDFRVRAQVLIAPHFFVEDISISAIAKAREMYQHSDLREKLSRYHDNVDCAFIGWSDVWLSDEFRHWNISETIDYFRVPVLGIQGRDDQYGTLAQIQEIESRCYAPFEQLLLNNCQHSPHLQQADKTLAAISTFCSRVEAMEALT